MSQAGFQALVHDFETWDWTMPYEDVICLRAVSKNVHGEIHREQRDVQPCEALGCETLKSYFVGNAEASTGPCDDVPGLDGAWTDFEAVRAGLGGTPDGRAGHTGRFLWTSADGGTIILVRFRGMSRVGTHRAPYFMGADQPCEPCHFPFHWEGLLRGAIVEGEHQGCRLWASYAFKITGETEDMATIDGAVEGLVGCQCDPDAD